MKRRVATFTAKDNGGREYTINVFQDFIRVDTFGGSHEIPGMKTMETPGGEHVNYTSKGVYELLDGTTLRSDDPNAP